MIGKSVSLGTVLIGISCCPRPGEQAAADVGSQPEAVPVTLERQAPATSAPAPLVLGALRGLAASVCPPGPYTQPSGQLNAALIPNTTPTALDPADTEFHLYEGAVWLNGSLYFSDFKTSAGFPSRILRHTPNSQTPDEQLEVALADSGTNGLGLDATGSVLIGARHKSKSVVRFSADLSSLTDLATQYQGKPFNSPNDLVARSDGNVYFTDPDFQAGGAPDQATTNVYRVAPGGEVSVIDTTIENPNGISIAPDESALYVAGGLGQGFVKRYPIAEDGAVGAGEIVLQPVEVPDGMVFDCAGNLYVTEHTPRRVRVLAASGEVVATIGGFEHNVTNVAFGGPERKTLYVTTTGSLYQIELPTPGLPY